ncbi:nitrate/nitrite transporter NrtS [Shewanella sp. SG41-4]|uniref:nitrate/nitrite transporter NrtS n=1 Tax=Shewanella sp. SG41-4 TaxID=2760976 RepID=UPI001600633D|nr:nitrate/nitrite transporter NrtS [Shewanella sp. SG41-4]MBB1440345.1 nitrate/nitrite transporter NrtS [Shewanella sp. SG41-4]
MNQNSFILFAFSRKVMSRAFNVALLVGTILALINHGEKILSLTLSNEDFVKIVLTYLVPYGVSTWSAVQAIRSTVVQKTNQEN